MNNKKIYWKVCIDKDTDIALKKLIKAKGITAQSLLVKLLKNYIYENVGCLVDDERE